MVDNPTVFLEEAALLLVYSGDLLVFVLYSSSIPLRDCIPLSCLVPKALMWRASYLSNVDCCRHNIIRTAVPRTMESVSRLYM